MDRYPFWYTSDSFTEVIQINRWRNDTVKSRLRHQHRPSSCTFTLFQFNQTHRSSGDTILSRIALAEIREENRGQCIHLALLKTRKEYIPLFFQCDCY